METAPLQQMLPQLPSRHGLGVVQHHFKRWNQGRIQELLGSWLAIFLLVTGIMTLSAQPALAATAADTDVNAEISGAQLFEANCAGCHLNGGNIIRRGKTLKQKALKRNHVDTLEAVETLVSQGKGIMSAYADRLNSEEIDAVSRYVLEQAEAGWRS